MLRLSTTDESFDEIGKIMAERDYFKDQCQQMEKFLADYGLKWVGDGEVP